MKIYGKTISLIIGPDTTFIRKEVSLLIEPDTTFKGRKVSLLIGPHTTFIRNGSGLANRA